MFDELPFELLVKIFQFYFNKNNRKNILKLRFVNKRFSFILLEIPKFIKENYQKDCRIAYYELKKSKCYFLKKFVSIYEFDLESYGKLTLNSDSKITINHDTKNKTLKLTSAFGILIKISGKNHYLFNLKIKNFGGHVSAGNLKCDQLEIQCWSKVLTNVINKNFEFEKSMLTQQQFDCFCCML